jgi:cathepsin L
LLWAIAAPQAGHAQGAPAGAEARGEVTFRLGRNLPTAEEVAARLPVYARLRELQDAYQQYLAQKNVRRPASGCDPNLQRWDWRTRGKVLPAPEIPADGQHCGDCWAWSFAAQMEGALLMAGYGRSEVERSRQQILSCSNAGGCRGGDYEEAASWARANGVASTKLYPYEQVDPKEALACKAGVPGLNRLVAYGYIDLPVGDQPDEPAPRHSLKAALCAYGPISVTMWATRELGPYGDATTNPALQQVFDQDPNSPLMDPAWVEANFPPDNRPAGWHAVALVGWDDAKGAWLVKNSWGKDWGYQGFAWLDYDLKHFGKYPFFITAEVKGIDAGPAIAHAREKIRRLELEVEDRLDKAKALPD